jgi:hypothetical protein
LALFVAQLGALFLVLFAHNKCIDCIVGQRQHKPMKEEQLLYLVIAL